MARILLNTRASRITIVDGILLLPAEVREDDRLGKIVVPSKTLISERGSPSNPSMFERISKDAPTQKLIEARVLEWSPERAEEPEPEAGPDGQARPDPVEPPKYRDPQHAAQAAALGRSNATSPTGGFLPREDDKPPAQEPNADAARAELKRLETAEAGKAQPSGVDPGNRVRTDEAVDAVPVVDTGTGPAGFAGSGPGITGPKSKGAGKSG
jgi:hypothetical protein